MQNISRTGIVVLLNYLPILLTRSIGYKHKYFFQFIPNKICNLCISNTIKPSRTEDRKISIEFKLFNVIV